MQAFDKAIKKINEINIDDELKPIFIKVLKNCSLFFDKHKDIDIDFNKLFDDFLYHNISFEIIDENSTTIPKDAEGQFKYNNGNPKIYAKSNTEKCLQHNITHEFIHFIVHCSHRDNLPDWADEMMTEYTAKTIDGAYYGQYGALLTLKDRLDKYVEEITFEDFFNNKIDDYLKKHKLYIDIPMPRTFRISSSSYFFLDIITKQAFANNPIDYNAWIEEMLSIKDGVYSTSYWTQFGKIIEQQLAQNSRFYKKIDTSNLINSIKNYYLLKEINEHGYTPDKIILLQNNDRRGSFHTLIKCDKKLMIMHGKDGASGFYITEYGRDISLSDGTIIEFDEKIGNYNLMPLLQNDKMKVQVYKTDSDTIILDIKDEISLQKEIGKRLDEKMNIIPLYKLNSSDCKNMFDEINKFVIDTDYNKQFIIGKIKDSQQFSKSLHDVAFGSLLPQFYALNYMQDCKTLKIESDMQIALLQYLQNNDCDIGDCIEIAKSDWASGDTPILQAKITEDGIFIQPHYFYYGATHGGQKSAKLYKDKQVEQIRKEMKTGRTKENFDSIAKHIV